MLMLGIKKTMLANYNVAWNTRHDTSGQGKEGDL